MLKTIKNSLYLVAVLGLLFVAYSCSDDSTVTPTGPEANSVNGTVSFADTNFISSGGTYLISAYPSTAWPPTGGPSSYDTVRIRRENNAWVKSYNYTLKGLSSGDYVIAVGWKAIFPPTAPSYVQGTYGCDTLHGPCVANPTLKATIQSNNAGVSNINFLSWADTSKALFKP
jgi:hypothetical protein